MRKLVRWGWTAMAVIAGLGSTVQAQNVQVNPGAGDYPTLQAAFAAINAGTHTGAIEVTISGDTTETAAALLNASGSGAASYTSVLVRPIGARSVSGAIAAGGPLVDFAGADNVTVDGLNSAGNSLTISNTTASATSGTSTIRFAGDATNNTLTNLSILGSPTMAVGTNGGIVWFAAGAVTTGNDSNTISNSLLGPAGATLPSKAVFCNGTQTNQTVGNSQITITNNRIADVFSATTTSAGIHVAAGCNTWTVSDNRFFQTAPRTWTTGANHRPIEILGTSATGGTQGNTITGNVIGFASAAETGTYALSGATGKFAAIVVNAITGGALNRINNNRITAVSLTGVTANGTSTSSPFIGILAQNGRFETNGNQIGDQATNGALSFATNTTIATDVYGIFNFSVDNTVASNNQIGGITAANAGATGAFITYGIRINTGTTNTVLAEDNRIGGTVANSIQNTSASTTAQTLGLVTNNAIATWRRNTVRNLTGAGGTGTSATASVIGLAATSVTPVHLLQDNRIHDLANTSAAAATIVNGIYFTGGNGSIIERTRIERLSVASATGIVNGIQIQGGTNTLRNNKILLGTDALGGQMAAGPAISGIFEFLGTNTIVNNSILVSGTGVGGAGNTFAFNGQQTVNTRAFQNNNFINTRSNGAGTGTHYGIRVGGTGVNPTGLTSNFNNVLANGTGGVFGFYEAANRVSLGDWQAATGQDANSLNVDPLFASATDLHLTAASPVRDQATALPNVTDDFDQDTRPGANALVDIGADEFDGTPPIVNDAQGQVFINPGPGGGIAVGGTYSPQASFRNNGINGLTNVTVRYRILDAGMVEVYNQTFVIPAMGPGVTVPVTFPSTSIGTAGTYGMRARAELAGDTVPANDELVGTFNVLPPMAGTYTVGTGGDFASLTNAGGFFQTLNNLGASANITANIISDLSSESGANVLNPVSGGFSVLIRPAGDTRVVTGSSAAGLIVLNGADNVTIDGSLAGGSAGPTVGGDASLRRLIFNNTATATTSGVIHVSTGTDGLGAQNVTLRNLNVFGQDPTQTLIGIAVGGTTLGTVGADNDNLVIENCAVRRALFGIYAAGASAANPNTGSVIRRNDLTGLGVDRIRRVGILVFNQDGIVISENHVAGIETNESADAIGIGVGTQGVEATFVTSGGVSNALVSRNRVDGVASLSTVGFSAAGIAVAGGNAGPNTLVNNMVAGITAPATSPDLVAGIFIAGAPSASTSLAHNSVSLFGDRGTVANQMPGFGLAMTGTDPTVQLRNNVFATTQVASGGGANAKAYAIGTTATTFVNLDTDFNLYWSSGAQAGNFRSGSLGAGTGVEYATLLDWQTAIADDAAALFADPLYTSSDLHITAASPANGAATVLPAVTVDIDNETRPATGRDIGADERVGNLQISPTSLAFGNVVIGQTSAAQSVTLTNTGSADVSVTAIDAPIAPFSQSGNTCGAVPFTLAPAATCQLSYQFAPTGAGAANQTIDVTADSPGTGDFALGGTGVAAGSISIAPTTVAFGNVAIGATSPASTVTLSNPGGAPATVTALTAASAPFAQTGAGTCGPVPITINAGGNCTLTFTFAPTAAGLASQVLTVTEGANPAGTITLEGTGVVGNLTIAPATLGFGDQIVGTTSNFQLVTLGNNGGAPLNASVAAPTGPFARVAGGTCPATSPFAIAAGASCTVRYVFQPVATGAAIGSVSITADAPGSGSVALTGNGTQGVLTITPASRNFGNQQVGQTSAAQTITLGNTGTAPLQVTGLTAATSPFARAAGGTCSLSLPIVIAPGTACDLSYTFTPLAVGTFQQVLTVTANSPGSGTITLDGVGEFIDDLFADGFEDVTRIIGKRGSFPLAGVAAAVTMAAEGQPVLVSVLADDFGPAVRAYARRVGTATEVGLAVRGQDGAWRHLPWHPLGAGAGIEFMQAERPGPDGARFQIQDAIVH